MKEALQKYFSLKLGKGDEQQWMLMVNLVQTSATACWFIQCPLSPSNLSQQGQLLILPFLAQCKPFSVH